MWSVGHWLSYLDGFTPPLHEDAPVLEQISLLYIFVRNDIIHREYLFYQKRGVMPLLRVRLIFNCRKSTNETDSSLLSPSSYLTSSSHHAHYSPSVIVYLYQTFFLQSAYSKIQLGIYMHKVNNNEYKHQTLVARIVHILLLPRSRK